VRQQAQRGVGAAKILNVFGTVRVVAQICQNRQQALPAQAPVDQLLDLLFSGRLGHRGPCLDGGIRSGEVAAHPLGVSDLSLRIMTPIGIWFVRCLVFQNNIEITRIVP
jgi:hypothetical protein